jgi:hypothetical protein
VTEILIREEYKRIYAKLITPMLRGKKPDFALENGRKFHMCCSGASGMGKSLFMVYVIYQLIREMRENPDCTVKEIYVRDNSEGNTVLQLWPEQQYIPMQDLQGWDRRKKGRERLLFVDASLDANDVRINAHKLLCCSDRKDNYKEFTKCFMKTTLPPWTFEEIQTLCEIRKLNKSTCKRINEKFKFFGGSPRTLLGSNVDFDALINSFDLSHVKKFQAEPVASDKVTFRLVHLYPVKGDSRYNDFPRIRFASTKVAERLTERLLREENNFIIDCLKNGKHTKEDVVWSAWESICFRIFVHGLQKDKKHVQFKGKQWKATRRSQRKLWRTVTNELPNWGPKESKHLIYNSVDRVGSELNNYVGHRCILAPSYKNQEAVDGAMFVPRPRSLIFFQFTLAESHSLKLRGLVRFLNGLNPVLFWPDSIVLVVVIPPYRKDIRIKAPQFSTPEEAADEASEENTVLKRLTVFVACVSEEGVDTAQTQTGLVFC